MKLASLSNKPFSRHGERLANEIGRSIQTVIGLAKAILVNQYQTRPKDRLSRQNFCSKQQISIEDYEGIKRQGLMDFAKVYEGGELQTNDEEG